MARLVISTEENPTTLKINRDFPILQHQYTPGD